MSVWIAAVVFFIFAHAVLEYWIPYAGLRLRGHRVSPLSDGNSGPRPLLQVIIPCHDGASSLRGLLRCLAQQAYPRDRFRVLVLADNCEDNTAEVAREAGTEVFERHNLANKGKTAALNECLDRRLRHADFDALVFFDVDSRMGADFLEQIARHQPATPTVLMGAPYSKNPDVNGLTRLGDLIQALVRTHQSGCRALGLYPIPMGGFGMTVPRLCLEKLEWRIGNGVTGDDLELEVRCCLLGIPVVYEPALRVFNDVPDDSRIVRQQRRRWISNPREIGEQYGLSLLRQGLLGNWRALHLLFGFIMCPSFSLLFLGLSFSAAVLSAWSHFQVALQYWAIAMDALWGCYLLYLILALRWERAALRWHHVANIPRYITLKSAACFDSWFHRHSKEWFPTPHKSDEEIGFAHQKHPAGSGSEKG